MAVHKLPHNDTAGDDREVRSQRAFAAEMPQHGHVVIDNRQKHFGCQIFAIGCRQIDRAALSRVVDDVDHETHEAVYEVLPCTRFASEAAIQQTAINFRQRHRHHLLASANSAQFTFHTASSTTGSDSVEAFVAHNI